MFSLVPNMVFASVCELTPTRLKTENIRVLLMDFDNTILPYTCDIPTEEVIRWLRSVTDAGIRLCILSNTRKGRAAAFAKKYGIDCITGARKPFQRGIRRAKQMYSEYAGNMALVGDQIYTDVLAANRGGMQSILIRPIHLHNVWLKLRHFAELPWIAIGRYRFHAQD